LQTVASAEEPALVVSGRRWRYVPHQPLFPIIRQEEQVMPLKLTAGISRKLGLPGYSSVGAICHVELELDSGRIQKDPEAFRAQVREVYAQCAESVEEELARHQAPRNPARPALEVAAEGCAAVNGHGSAIGHAGANGDGHAQGDSNSNCHANGFGHPASRANGRVRSRPSARQMEYAQTLAGRVGMDAGQLEGLCQRLFEKPVEELSGGEASGLIRALQEIREGWLGPDAIYRPEGE